MERKPLEVVSLSKKEFDNQRVKPDNVLFFVYEEYVSEDKKAKVRLRLYKGPHLICGDLYESVLKLGKEVNSLKEVVGDGTGDCDCSFKIGEVKMLPAGSQPEVTNTGDEKNVVLNVGFPFRTIYNTTTAENLTFKGIHFEIQRFYPDKIKEYLEGDENRIIQILRRTQSHPGRNRSYVYIKNFDVNTHNEVLPTAPQQFLYRCDGRDLMMIEYFKHPFTSGYNVALVHGGTRLDDDIKNPITIGFEQANFSLEEDPDDNNFFIVKGKYTAIGLSDENLLVRVKRDFVEKNSFGRYYLKPDVDIPIIFDFEKIPHDEFYRFSINFFQTHCTKIEFCTKDSDVYNVNYSFVTKNEKFTTGNYFLDLAPYGIRENYTDLYTIQFERDYDNILNSNSIIFYIRGNRSGDSLSRLFFFIQEGTSFNQNYYGQNIF